MSALNEPADLGVVLRYCPQVDEETVGELAARLCARAAQWWDDNDTWEDEA